MLLSAVVLATRASYPTATLLPPLVLFVNADLRIAVLLFATGLAFQVPAIQVVLGSLGIVSGQKMLSYWKYVVVLCTILAAVITPSTDPITQLLLSSALLTLYLGGSGFVIFLKK